MVVAAVVVVDFLPYEKRYFTKFDELCSYPYVTLVVSAQAN